MSREQKTRIAKKWEELLGEFDYWASAWPDAKHVLTDLERQELLVTMAADIVKRLDASPKYEPEAARE